jgi:NADPH2:quinone reductase
MVSEQNETVPPQTTTIPMRSEPLPAVMKAVAYQRYGGAEQLSVCELDTPRPRPGRLVIRVRAASINPIDCRLRRGEMKWLMPGGFPRVPGYDVAGEVAQCDPECRYRVGDRVVAFLDNVYGGGCAEYAQCRPSAVTSLPDEISFEDAAAIPLAASTALQGLRDKATIKPGDRVLINGASGGVGVFAVQIAKILGAHVTGVASGKNESLVRSLGADEFIDYRQQRLSRMQRSWHVLFDVAGKLDYFRARHLINRHGSFVSTEPDAGGLATTLVTKLGIKPRYHVMLAQPRHRDLADLVNFVLTGQMRVIRADTDFSLDNLADAHRMLESGGHYGKIVLKV